MLGMPEVSDTPLSDMLSCVTCSSTSLHASVAT